MWYLILYLNLLKLYIASIIKKQIQFMLLKFKMTWLTTSVFQLLARTTMDVLTPKFAVILEPLVQNVVCIYTEFHYYLYL